MNSKTDGDMIKKYSVKIIYKHFNKKRQGSGVLIKVSESICYLITARHNFKERDDDSFIDVNIEELRNTLNFIDTTKDSKEKICTIKSLVYERKDLDLVIFLIDSPSKIVKNIPLFDTLLKDERFYQEEHFFFGYRKDKNGRTEDDLRHIGEDENNNNFILKRGLSIRSQNYYSGYSGSGVFIKKEGVFYLVGIVVIADDEIDNYEAINLSKVIEDINDKLNSQFLPKIPIKENVFEIIDIDKMYSQIFARHPENFLLKKTNYFIEKNHLYKDLIMPSDNLKNLISFMDSTNEFQKLEAKYTQELADMYLLSAFISSRYDNSNKNALLYLRKAIEFRSEYIIFLAEIDKENSKEELILAGKIALLEYKYSHAKDCFKKVLSLKVDEEEKIEVYELLIKIFFSLAEEKEERFYSKKLLKLYQDSHLLKKANLYYRLSMMDIDKLEKSEYVEYGLLEIEYITNPSFFEIQYKLKKRRNEFSGIKEEILKTTDSYLDLRNALKKLSFVNKNYKSEYKQIVLKEIYKDIIKKTSSRIWLGLLLSIFILPLLLFILTNISKSNYKINKKITNCSQKYMNGFQVEECHFIKDKNHTIIYDVNSTSKAIILQGFSSAQSDFSEDMKIFLKDVFHYKMYNLERIENVKIYGHTDLEYYENNISSNEYLGEERAFKVKKVISMEMNKSKIEAQYNSDFFMRDTDKILNNTLLKVLNLNDEVALLIDELKISKKSTIEQIRNDFKDRDLAKYRNKFAPFRSVIILINLKEETLWDRIRKILNSFYSI